MRFPFAKRYRSFHEGSPSASGRIPHPGLIFSAVLIFSCLCAGSLNAADFREKALGEAEKAQIETLIFQLGSTSSRTREEAGRQLLQYGSSAIPLLKEAGDHEDFTIAESADFYLQMLQNGIHRTGDPPRVAKLLKQYESSRLKHLRLLPIYALTYLPEELALTPLLRITLQEKDPHLSRLAALGTYRALPGKRNFTKFPILFPEERPYPDPHFWETENQKAEQSRKALIPEIRQYLLAESVQTSGKQLLLALLALEEALDPALSQASGSVSTLNSPESNTDTSQQETDQAAGKLRAFRDRFLDRAAGDPDPMDLLFMRELDLTLCCTLYQAGRPEMADDFFQNVFMRKEYSLRENTLPSMEMHKNLVILFFRQAQLILHEGHTEWCIRLLDSLFKDMEMREKNVFSPPLISIWKSLGQYDAAIALCREVRHFSFLSKNSDAQKNVDQMADVLVSLNSLKDIQEQKYAEAGTRLENYLKKTPMEELDIDLLILARQLAQFTKDEARMKDLDSLTQKFLDASEKKITLLGQNPFTDPEEKSLALNEFAWLAANTGSRLEKALEYAQEMTQLRPESAGLADTLGMVHFARKEYEKAFEVQKKAHEMDPTEPQIFQNLERFRVWLPQK